MRSRRAMVASNAAWSSSGAASSGARLLSGAASAGALVIGSSGLNAITYRSFSISVTRRPRPAQGRRRPEVSGWRGGRFSRVPSRSRPGGRGPPSTRRLVEGDVREEHLRYDHQSRAGGSKNLARGGDDAARHGQAAQDAAADPLAQGLLPRAGNQEDVVVDAKRPQEAAPVQRHPRV